MNHLEPKINEIIEKYKANKSHANQVARLSLMLFDKTKGIIHDFSDDAKMLLQTGALLHDIGYFIGVEKHNRHSYDLIMKEDFDELSKEEIYIIATIARHHRGRLPKDDHECYSGFLKSKHRKNALKLASFVRLTDALDRRNSPSNIKELECNYDEASKALYIKAAPDNDDFKFDIEALIRKKDLFEKMFEIQAIVLANPY